ncbi:aldehyde dehydrogenase family protein, partial [Marinobacterium zhoushanense]|uniref:aldehyde dehydrogenase family protein n=1 Tax=Marinobacterium zhoushanense TaxID=1679163 RepID=UPI00166CE361
MNLSVCNLLINGDNVTGQGAAFDVINPATEAAIASGRMASVEQLDQAVAAARQAFQSWRKTS